MMKIPGSNPSLNIYKKLQRQHIVVQVNATDGGVLLAYLDPGRSSATGGVGLLDPPATLCKSCF